MCPTPHDIRRRLTITGQVQGVGFRPFVYRIALDHELTGSVRNTPEGVIIEVQAAGKNVDAFGADLTGKLPPLARIVTLEQIDIDPVGGETAFKILASTVGKGHTVLISPDVATCPDCLADMRDPNNRRYRYPFTNCTNCGPRYTITRSIPYDRPVTSMACFPMCPDCQGEYEDPLDRRFHAQPNACPVCGPEVWLTDRDGGEIARGDEALVRLAELLTKGNVAAIKGLGGFHLACDATNTTAVRTLRERKNRPDKPLAVMVPDLDTAKKLADISDAEAEWLTGMFRPIMLARKPTPAARTLELPERAISDGKRPEAALSHEVAPDTNFLGIMLPYTPLHHVLLEHVRALSDLPALVMTSGNMSSEPISLGNREALRRLPNICDVFLFHNRDILIRTDDSVLRVNPRTNDPLLLRRARGFTPSPVFLSEDKGHCVLGVGPELKCTLTLTKDGAAFPSQHIGDMENLDTLGFHQEITTHLMDILQVRPELIVHDLHPDYMTTSHARELAEELGVPTAPLQHHFAHVHAVLAENKHESPVLGIALDGTGFGEDGTIWGGEILYVDPATLEHRRMGRFAPFVLPGGEMAVREPWRIAFGLLREMGHDPASGDWPWSEEFSGATKLLDQMLARGVNCIPTSSCGRLFDAVSALMGLRTAIRYEGQAAIVLEKVQDMNETGTYPFPLVENAEGPADLDTRALFGAVLEDVRAGVDVGIMARRFHRGLVAGVADAAATLAKNCGTNTVALSGGVMQNLTLAVELPEALEARGLTVLVHTKVSPNDGCISLGQAAWGRKKLLLES